MTLSLIDAVRNIMCDAIVDSVDGGAAGTIAIRSGTRPTLPTDAVTGTLLATVTLANPAFGSAALGVATIVAPAGVAAAATGTASWFRAFNSAAAAKFDGSVTATGGGGDLTLSTVSIVAGATVAVTGGTINVPAS